jgi:hypothetical protein
MVQLTISKKEHTTKEINMTYEQKNTLVSLGATFLILIFYLVRLTTIVTNHGLVEPQKFYNLWFWIIGLTIGLTIIGTIATHIGSAVTQAVNNPGIEPEIDSVEDERDQIIKLKGTNMAYIISSVGVGAAMLSLVLGADALVMFNILILVGLFANIGENVTKLVLYGRGF